MNLQGWSWSHRLEDYVGDLKRELEVHERVGSHQRSLRSSELSLVIVVRFTMNCYHDCKSQFDIVDCSLEIVPSWFLH